MTCCIATACEGNRLIVTASDTKLSYGYASSDEFFKLVRLHHPYWLGMIAGDVALAAESVTRTIQQTLAVYKPEPPTALQVRAAIIAAWRDVRNEVGAAVALNAVGMDVRTFQEKGRDRLGSENFDRLLRDLYDASKLGFDLLSVGFDENGIPTIFICNDDYPSCPDLSRDGRAAIGSGHATAISMLALQDYSVKMDKWTAVYHVCAAKFAAEKADGVGRETVVCCLRHDGKTCFIEGGPIEKVRVLYESSRQFAAPERAALQTALAFNWENR